MRGTPVAGLRSPGRPTPVRPSGFRSLLEQLAPAAGPGAAPPTRFVPRAVLPRPTMPTPPSAEPAAPRPLGLRGAARERLAAAIRESAGDAGVDPALSVAVARAESNLDPSARSSDGLSVGTFQVTHYTKAEMKRKIASGIVDRPRGTDDVALGVGYLRYLDDLFARDARLVDDLHTVRIEDAETRRRFVAAAFNAGEGRVAQAQARAARTGGDPTDFDAVRPHLPSITRGYVDRVIRWADGARGSETLSS